MANYTVVGYDLSAIKSAVAVRSSMKQLEALRKAYIADLEALRKQYEYKMNQALIAIKNIIEP